MTFFAIGLQLLNSHMKQTIRGNVTRQEGCYLFSLLMAMIYNLLQEPQLSLIVQVVDSATLDLCAQSPPQKYRIKTFLTKNVLTADRKLNMDFTFHPQ
jgi:hypothetical protein